MIDRIAPARRPHQSVAGYQRWRQLLFMHWQVRVDVLRRLVPEPLELDLFEGKAYVGVVPFAMEGVRPVWWPERLAWWFLETNVRTYVLCGNRPGVYFFSLDANSRIAVQAARAVWKLPYYHARMEMERREDRVKYTLQRSGCRVRHQVCYQAGDLLEASAPGSLQHFFLERYLLFVERRHQVCVGQVHHVPYPVQAATVELVTDDLMAAAGMPGMRTMPDFAHYSAGVDVEIFPLLGAGILAKAPSANR
jgi:uncharacterized protein YqjF (DUF2071 family)